MNDGLDNGFARAWDVHTGGAGICPWCGYTAAEMLASASASDDAILRHWERWERAAARMRQAS